MKIHVSVADGYYEVGPALHGTDIEVPEEKAAWVARVMAEFEEVQTYIEQVVKEGG